MPAAPTQRQAPTTQQQQHQQRPGRHSVHVSWRVATVSVPRSSSDCFCISTVLYTPPACRPTAAVRHGDRSARPGSHSSNNNKCQIITSVYYYVLSLFVGADILAKIHACHCRQHSRIAGRGHIVHRGTRSDRRGRRGSIGVGSSHPSSFQLPQWQLQQSRSGHGAGLTQSSCLFRNWDSVLHRSEVILRSDAT